MPKKSAKKAVRKAVAKTAKKVVKKTVRKSTGAGRPKGSGKFGCETKAVRIPAHLEKDVQDFVAKKMKTAK